MALSPELISSLLGDLYEAAATPSWWQVFLNRLRDLSQSSKAYFLLVDPEQRCDLSLQTGWDDSFAAVYATDWHKQDIVLDSFVAAQHRAGGDWIGDRESVLDDRTFLSSAVYNDLIRPQGDRHLCAAALGAMPDGLQGGFAMRRAANQPEYEPDIISLLAILAPHMKRALGLHRTLTGISNLNVALADSVEAFQIAVLSVDAKGKVIHASPAAASLLAQADGLKLLKGHLRAAKPREDSALQKLLLGAAATGSGSSTGPLVTQSLVHAPQAAPSARYTPSFGGAVLITRRAPLPPLQVTVTPFRSQHVLRHDSPSALIFLSDPGATPLPRGQVLRALYGLTHTEVRLADLLLAGLDVKQAAQTLRITENTARFHLKEIFRKTGTHTQSALVRLLLGLPSCG